MKLYLVTYFAKNRADSTKLLYGGAVNFGDTPDDAWCAALGGMVVDGIDYREWEDWQHKISLVDPDTIMLAARDIEVQGDIDAPPSVR